MDKLNAAIADKVLEISSADNNEVRDKLQKINRFRDFVNACQSLIKKYPDIETELLRMIRDNDFDARIASARVDTIIRLSENNQIKNTVTDVEDDIHQLEDIVENLPIQNNVEALIEEKETIDPNIDKQIQSVPKPDTQSYISGSPDRESKESKSLPEAEPIDEEKESQYVDFEEVSDTDNVNEKTSDSNIKTATIPINDNLTDLKDNDKASTTKKVLWAVAAIAVVVILYFVIKFIIDNWNTILWILGICAVVALIIWYFLKRKKQ